MLIKNHLFAATLIDEASVTWITFKEEMNVRCGTSRSNTTAPDRSLLLRQDFKCCVSALTGQAPSAHSLSLRPGPLPCIQNPVLQHAADGIERAKHDDAISGGGGLEGGLQGLFWRRVG